MSAGPQVLPPPTLPGAIWDTPLTDKNGLVSPSGIWGHYLMFLPSLAQSGIFVEGTHAQRMATPASSYNDGSFFLETDRLLLYIAVGGQWFYALGIYSVTQNALPNDLTVNDQGLRVNVTDFAHELNWNATANAWQFAPADAGSGYTATFISNQPPGTGWIQCDGSGNVPYLLSDGTLDFIGTLPNTAGLYFRQ